MEDLVELAAFVAVAGTLHLGRAAEDLGVPRTTLAGRLRRLESRLDVLLVDRSHRCRIALTQDGAALVPAARRAVEAAGDFLSQAAAVRAGERGVVRVGLIAEPDERVDRLTDALRSVHPAWRIDVVEMRRTAAARALAIGGLECVISDRHLGPTTRSGLVDRRPNRHEPRTGVRIDSDGLCVVWRRRWAARCDASPGPSPAREPRQAPRSGGGGGTPVAAARVGVGAGGVGAPHAAVLEVVARDMARASLDARYPGRVRIRRTLASRRAALVREQDLRRREERRLGAEPARTRAVARERRRALLRLWKGYVRGDPDVCAFVDGTRADGFDVGLGMDPERPRRGVPRRR